METTSLSISQCSTTCSNCNLRTDFLMFESGAGGEFQTYVGENSNTIYRIDMTKIHYLNFKIVDLLAPAIEIENELRSIPEQVKCKICNSVFKASAIESSENVTVNAVQL